MEYDPIRLSTPLSPSEKIAFASIEAAENVIEKTDVDTMIRILSVLSPSELLFYVKNVEEVTHNLIVQAITISNDKARQAAWQKDEGLMNEYSEATIELEDIRRHLLET
jgi:hypothetical protein